MLPRAAGSDQPFSRQVSRGMIDPIEQNPVGFDTPQNKVLQGIRLHGTKPGEVSDPAEHVSTLYSMFLFCGVWYRAERYPVGSDTPWNKVLLSIRPRIQNPVGSDTPRAN
jgi:hypothetical protein